MATKAKENTVVGKEKKAPSSNSHITSTKRTTKPSLTTTTRTSSTNKANSNPSEKNIPNYLKPTISSCLESLSFKQPKSEAPTNPYLNRRRSFDKPLSSSNLTTKQTQPSHSRLQKALVSPGPRERSVLLRCSSVPIKSTKPSKPISDRNPKTPSDGKTRPLFSKSAKKSTTNNNATSTNTKKVIANENASANSTNASKNKDETTEEVKEVTDQEVEVIKVENEEHEVEHVSEISPDVDSELHEQEDYHNQADDEKVISTVSEEEAEKELQEEKHEDEKEEEENTNQDESNKNMNHPEEHSASEGEVVVNDKKEDEEGGVIIEDQKSENNNEEVAGEEKEEVEGIEEAMEEPTPPKQQHLVAKGQRKESQVSNDVIEETASKLLEARKNKVRALAGAFQTVIDYQTTSR